QAVHLIGMPEAQLTLAQGVTYLANAPKSTAPMDALYAAYYDIDNLPIGPVPMHLRNAANQVMKDLGAGKGYVRYEKNDPEQFKNQQFLPDNVKHHTYYDASLDRQPKRKSNGENQA
ncbi:MAG TPA: replication-associated recombination protein A, partial [Patescibacteria group bacterium]